MEAKELRIGNLIDQCTINVNTGEYEFNYRTVDYHVIHDLLHDHGIYDSVPLTEDWLLKFGFMKSTAWYRMGPHAINPTIAYLYEFRNIPIKEVQYVHELQNLYFALTGKELTLKSE